MAGEKDKNTKLTDIAVTHISLVKAGANGKSIIYKSSDKEPSFTRQIEIKKSDDEKGIVYGIVYAPDQIDTDGEYTDSDEIIKAAYAFMKARNTTNVDQQHDFNNVDAFVAESWIVKANDSVFPDEPVGAWAVAIQLESDELKKGVKNGEIAGISMAGTAVKKEVEEPAVVKADTKSFSMDDVIEMFKKVFSRTSVSIDGYVYNDDANVIKSKEGDETLKKDEIEKTIKDEIEKAVKPLTDENKTLKKENAELKDQLKKSKQDDVPPAAKEVKKEDEIKGIL